PRSTLFPYTTLFRSSEAISASGGRSLREPASRRNSCRGLVGAVEIAQNILCALATVLRRSRTCPRAALRCRLSPDRQFGVKGRLNDFQGRGSQSGTPDRGGRSG